MKKIICLIAATILSGCASTGPVQIGKDTYTSSKQGTGGVFQTLPMMRADLIRESTAFCAQSGKVFQLNSYQDTTPNVSRLATEEIYFMCLDASDPEVARIKQQRQPDAVIEARQR